MRVLVTGAAGSIGRRSCRDSPPLGHELRGLDLAGGGSDGCSLGWITGDCLDPAVAAEAVAGVDAVVHLAGNPTRTRCPPA